MASRRFKFKPKPVISAVARRPKDSLDITEHVNKEASIEQIKDSSDSFDTTLGAESVEKESLGVSSQSQETLKSGIILKNRSKIVEDDLSTNLNNKDFEESTKINYISIDSVVPAKNKPNDTHIYEKDEHEVLESNNDIKFVQNVSRALQNNCSTQPETSLKNNTYVLPETEISFKSCATTPSENKTSKTIQDKPKIVSKFGRFRCKPVLPGTTHRRKAEESNQTNSVDNVLQLKTVDSCDTLEKSKQCESLVNTEDIVVETQKASLTNSSDQNDCDIINKFSSTELSKSPLSPVKSVHKTFSFKPVPRFSENNRRPSLQAIENEEDSNQNKDVKDDSKNYKELLEEEKQLMSKKEQFYSKNKRQPRSQLSTFARMGQDAMDKLKSKFGDQNPAKNEMTMLDLIFYNPKSNPMTQKPVSVINTKRKLELDSKDSIGLIEETLTEQSVDDVDEPSNHAIPVPQLKVGPDGQVILDPQSLIIETTDVRKNRENLENSEIVQETEGSYGSYFKKRSKRNEWTPEETLQFYRALNTLGTDFALMASLFPKRTRRDLKLKFKREERVNLHLIDKAVTQPMEFDFNILEEEMKQEADLIAFKASERERIKKEVKEERERLKKLKGSSIGRKKKLYGSEVFRQFVEEDIGEFRTLKSQNKRRAKYNKIQNIKELKDNFDDYNKRGASDDLNDKEEIKRIRKATRSGKIPKRSKCVKTEVEGKVERKKRKTGTLNKGPCKKRKKNSPVKDKENKYGYLNENGTVPGLFEEPWDLTVPSIPDIEANILGSSQGESESVSMISELGSSFVDEVNNMDPSTDSFVATVESFTEQLDRRALPPYSSIVKHNNFEGKPSADSSILNTRLLTESMKIVDQLTSNLGEDNNESVVFIENEGSGEINTGTEPVNNSSVLAEEPVLVTFVPSDSSTLTNSSYYNVEIQMPFKIRQKQMKFAKAIQHDDQGENKECADKSVTSNNKCASEKEDQRLSNPERIEEVERISECSFDKSISNSVQLNNVNSNMITPVSSICQSSNEGDDSCLVTSHTSEASSDILEPRKSFLLNSDGIIRADNISMFIPRFEIITGDCLGNNSCDQANLLSSAQLNETGNFIILEPIDETVVETDTTSQVVYSTRAPDDADDPEFILGE